MAHLTSLKLLNVRFPTQNKTNIVQYVFVADLEFTGAARVFKSKFFCGLAAVSKRLNNTALKYMYVGPIP